MKNPTFDNNGFRRKPGGAHTSRTIMLDELDRLFTAASPDATIQEYGDLIVKDNALGKRSQDTRVKTFKYLKDLYSLDASIPLFHAMRYYWQKDSASSPLLALLLACARDWVIKNAAPNVLETAEHAVLLRSDMEHYIENHVSNQFSAATLESTAINVNSSFTKTGHLKGRVSKIRQRASPTAASVAFALYICYLEGGRGRLLFESFWIELLDCTPERAMELAELASSRGWLNFKRLGDVIDVTFPEMPQS